MTMAMGAVGGLFQAIGAMQAAEANARAAEYNEAVVHENAYSAREQGLAEQQQQRRDNARIHGRAEAAFGASGLALTGSLLDVYEDSAGEGELAVKMVEYHSEVRATGYENQADLYGMEAGAHRAAGPVNALGAFFGAMGKAYNAQN